MGLPRGAPGELSSASLTTADRLVTTQQGSSGLAILSASITTPQRNRNNDQSENFVEPLSLYVDKSLAELEQIRSRREILVRRLEQEIHMLQQPSGIEERIESLESAIELGEQPDTDLRH